MDTKILVAFNEAPTAIAGARYAAQVAERAHARLRFAYVSSPLPPSAMKSGVADQVLAADKSYVNDLLSDAAETLGVDAERVHTRGHPVQEFLSQLSRADVSLAVIAPRVRTGLGKVLYGGFAWRVAMHADKPVLVARGDPETLPLVQNGSKRPIYVVGVDGSPASIHALKGAIAFAKQNGAALHVVSVIEPLFIAESFAIPSELVVAEQKQAEEALRGAKELVRDAVPTTYETAVGSAGPELQRIAQEKNAALIVAGDTGRGRTSRAVLGSATDRLVNLGDRSVLLFHGPKA